MKKKLFGALLVAAAGVSLASCGGKDTSHTITFWHTMGDSLQAVLNPAIAEFEEKYKDEGWKVESVQIGSYDDVRNQTISYIAAGNNPSLVYCYPDHVAAYNKANAVVDLNQYIKSTDPEIGLTEAQVNDFVPGYYAEGSSFGDPNVMYTLPFSKSTEVLYYNKTFFDDWGLTVPTTWDEMEEVCATIKAMFPETYPLGLDSEANFFITTAEQKGAAYTAVTSDNNPTNKDHYLFDNQANRDTVKMIADWFNKGYVMTQTENGTYTSSLFVAQTSYMSIGSTGGANHQKPDSKAFEVGIAPIPTFVKEGSTAEASLKCISQGPSLCMLTQTSEEKMLMTWKFMRDYLLTTEFQASFSMASGYNPVLESVYQNPTYKEFLAEADEPFATVESQNVTALSAKTSSTLSDHFFVSPAFNGSSTARDEVGALIQKVIKNVKTTSNLDSTIDSAFKDAIANCIA